MAHPARSGTRRTPPAASGFEFLDLSFRARTSREAQSSSLREHYQSSVTPVKD
jgi:hypothetical protein